MVSKSYNVLFLCTGNSARSIIAEGLINKWGAGRFKGYSAGSHPTDAVNPQAIEVLSRHKVVTEGLRSKSWNEFAVEDAPEMDFVFTVCDRAASEPCPTRAAAMPSSAW